MSIDAEGQAGTEAVSLTRTGRAVALLGDHWILLILQRVFMGDRKYQEIREAVQVSDSVLSNRLKAMTEGGLLSKTPYRDGRIRYEYCLTDAGKATWRIFVAAWSWEKTWLERPQDHRIELRHSLCGEHVAPILVCGRCLLPVTTRDTSIVRTAPKLSYDVSGPRRHRQRRTAVVQYDFGFLPETMELLGDRWNLALLSAAVIGIRRFTDFERYLGTPPAVLSAHLSRMVEIGVLRLQELAASNGRTDYRFTDKGRELSSVMMQVVRWADENVLTGEETSIEITHDPCGRKLVPEFACNVCEKVLKRHEIRFQLLNS
jgi:DNA-binding HxlR family transcriptional regulator